MIELEQAKDWYKAAVEQSQTARTEAELARDFYDGKQWTAAELKELKRRNQPAVTENLIKPNIETIVGLEIKSRTDVKGFPRNPSDEDAAEAATDALRFIADNNKFDKVKTEVARCYFIEGTAAGITEVLPKGDRFEVVQSDISYDRYFIDPHSERRDGTDKKYDGMAIWMDAEDAIEAYPDVDEGFFEPDEGYTEAHSDKPADVFYDHARKRVKLIEMYFRKGGKWGHAVFTGFGFVVEPRVSPYLDEDGLPQNPIETATAFIDRDNNRYGAVKDLIPLQREVNARRSRALHLLNTRQIEMEKGAVENVNQVRREAAKADGVIVRNPGKELEIRDNNDLAQGQVLLLQEAKQRIESVGANSALTGKDEKAQSGRALQARQQSGVLELTGTLDGLGDWEQRMYIQAWNRVKQFWDEERWIRVTDDERNIKFVALNRPVTAREVMLEEYGEEVVAEVEGDPRLDQIAQIQNPTSELDLDIILEDVPDIVNIQAEQFELLANVASANPDAIPFEMLIEMSSLRNKDRILERLKGGSPEEQEAVALRNEQAQRASDAAVNKDEAKAASDWANAAQTEVETQLALAGREAL